MLDLTNQTFGRRADALRANGGTRSCGCLQREAAHAFGHVHARGERFSRLVIIRQVGCIPKRGRLYRCLCDCGKLVTVEGRRLREGTVQSCGCWYRATRTTTIKHGQCRIARKTATYTAYQRRKSQCRNPRGRMARYYIGVKFLFDSFAQFYAEVGDKPGPDYWLVRINGTGHIEPGNLEWRPIRRHKKRRKRKPRS
jgi:hypothetical protein